MHYDSHSNNDIPMFQAAHRHAVQISTACVPCGLEHWASRLQECCCFQRAEGMSFQKKNMAPIYRTSQRLVISWQFSHDFIRNVWRSKHVEDLLKLMFKAHMMRNPGSIIIMTCCCLPQILSESTGSCKWKVVDYTPHRIPRKNNNNQSRSTEGFDWPAETRKVQFDWGWIQKSETCCSNDLFTFLHDPVKK